MNDDDLLFSGKDISDEILLPVDDNNGWKILIVDDEPEVHHITKLTLSNFIFENRGIDFLHAYSANEALSILEKNPDIALTLLDVVMETNHAGLELVKKIREELCNNTVRIVLRTGQPGIAPERDIIVNYDINDYAEKVELSAQKLFTIVVASLRAYRDILKLEDSRKELITINNDLDEQRERIQVTLDSIGDAVMTTDIKGNITHLNPVAEALTGWQLQAAIGQNIKEVFPIRDASSGEPITNPVDKVIATGETIYLSNHTTLTSKSGQRYQISDSAAPIRDKEKQIHGMVLVFNDVTEQYVLREENRRSRHNLQMIMDFTPAVVYAKDLDGCYIFSNQKFESLFDIKSENIVGKTDMDIFPAKFAEIYQANDQEVIATGKSSEYEEQALVGEELHYYLSVKFPLYDADNNIYACCAISTDITERKKQEEHLHRSQKMEALGQLTGGIAHDFNNQLGVVIGYLDFLDTHNKHDEEASKWVKTCIKATLRSMDLTRQLLSFSRNQNIEASVVDINISLMEWQNMFARTVTPAIDLQYFLSEDAWLTEINTGEFQDAMLNMVINARDAMPNGGSLIVETSNKCLDKDYIGLNPDGQSGSFVQIMLSDTGTGMDKATLEKIYEPFFTTKPKGEGTGLGMSMVYGFVKRYNGFIKIYSELGIGTTIRIYLPQTVSSENIKLTQPNFNDELPTGNETILVVDDEVDLLHLAEKCLKGLGYKIYLAENAQQALEMFSKYDDIDCLFSDVVMPGGINGYELAEVLTSQIPQLKVLLSSGFTSKSIVQNGQARFTENLLNKPYRKAELALRIRLTLDKT